MISLSDAKAAQLALRSQGERLLETFPVANYFESLGSFGFQGSYVYQLMVKPDIDCRVYAPNPRLDLITPVVATLMQTPQVARVKFFNCLDYSPDRGQPHGLYIGLKVEFERALWNFDIWYLSPDEELGIEFFQLGEASEHDRDTILLLKYQLSERSLYPGSKSVPGSFSSADVYRAVIRDQVSNFDQLLKWRTLHPDLNEIIN